MKRSVWTSSLVLVTILLFQQSAAASTYPLENVLPADAVAKLSKLGITSSDQLFQRGATPADRQKLAKTSGIAIEQLAEWVRMSDLLRIKGVGPVMTKLLGGAKIFTVAQLRKQKADKLSEQLSKLNEQLKITENPPSAQHLQNWISQAKALKIVVR